MIVTKIDYNRLIDPIRYKEACYLAAYLRLGDSTREMLESYSQERMIQWLGSNCGRFFIETAEELAESYPFKDHVIDAIVCGEIQKPGIVRQHIAWLNEAIKDIGFAISESLLERREKQNKAIKCY